MDTPYTVQSGDTLSKIAQRHGLTVADLQALNPIVKNPDHILPGWQLRLSGFPAQLDLPPPVNANSITSVAIEGQPECHEELVDVAHIPGHSHFYVLTHKQAKALKQEISAVQKLMDELHRNLADALPSAQCKKKQAPDAVCACSACVKETWTVKAEGANLLVREPRATAPAGPPPSSDQDLQGQLATLQSARDWYQAYTPPWKPSSLFESNWKKLQNKKILELDKQINALRVQLAAQRQDKPQGSRPPDSGAIPDLKHGKGRSGAHQLGRQTRTGINVVEVILFSDPSRRHYISTRYHETTQWRTRVSTQVLAGKPLGKSLARELINDIKSAISTTRKVGPLGGLEAKLSSWNNEDDTEFSQWLNPVLNALHQEVAWRSNHSDASRVAVTAEAHALRFAAIASAGVNSWNPREGTIDVGVKGNAAFSLAEASVALHSYFPDQGGYVASMVYRNALDQAVTHPIGVFRLHGKLELSCFAGVRAQAEAGVATGYRPSETSAGATALLGPPTVAITPHGSVGVKADGFAGAQLGGALSGAFQWVAPDDQGKGPAVLGQSNADGNWKDLARINLEGNAAAGVGLAGEFRIEISEDRLAVTCSGSVVFGPGAGGSFATVVDLEQVGRLAWLFCNALAAVDYRYLMGVTGDAFAYL
ncbi:LysM peptidoglycan-binding domain-containing protein, partial [Pseudomonas sp. GD03860]|uniref:LysM peptidoglycan-binding domain-containing protein n=1 Tax=Pseudomonas sp. GD03860 TaxID=2975389 RepID=UPI002448FCEB